LQIKNELEQAYEGGYPVIDKEQLDAPIAAELQINTGCNLRCKHCCQSSYNKEMSLKRVGSILNALYKANIFEINLVGGELFLHPKIFEIISLSCKKYSFATTIVTNGTLLSETTIKKLAKFKKNLVFLVSLEGVKKNNDIIRGKGVFAKADKTIKSLKKQGFYVEISTTINNSNIETYQSLIEYAEKLKVPLNFNLFKPFKPEQKYLILDPQKYFAFVEDIFRRRKRDKADIGLTNAAIASYLTARSIRKTCRATLSGLTINVDGKMVPCAFLGEINYYDETKLPDFNKDFLKEWKENDIFKKFREINLRECQACSYIFKGDIRGEDPYGLRAFRKHKSIKMIND
jgi:MoaA/NifB/PqqE/SkfB family radical SAM enzyme